jgi:hypothetical protein
VWRLTIRGRPDITARFVISSVGGYVNAKDTVDIDGVEDFVGTILRPNAWDDRYQTRGKRIAVIGTGSSGVQIAAALSTEAEILEVYQRTPAWVLPKIDFDIPPVMRKALRLPGVVTAMNVAGRTLMDVAMIAPIVPSSPGFPIARWSGSSRSTTATAGRCTASCCAPSSTTPPPGAPWCRATASWPSGQSSRARSCPP